MESVYPDAEFDSHDVDPSNLNFDSLYAIIPNFSVSVLR